MSNAYVSAYKAALGRKVNTKTCLEVFEYPSALPRKSMPKALLVYVGQALAAHDADMANALLYALKLKSSSS